MLFYAEVNVKGLGKEILPVSEPLSLRKPIKVVKVTLEGSEADNYYDEPLLETCKPAMSEEEQAKHTFYKVK